jgi:hypothetical protein
MRDALSKIVDTQCPRATNSADNFADPTILFCRCAFGPKRTQVLETQVLEFN